MTHDCTLQTSKTDIKTQLRSIQKSLKQDSSRFFTIIQGALSSESDSITTTLESAIDKGFQISKSSPNLPLRYPKDNMIYKVLDDIDSNREIVENLLIQIHKMSAEIQQWKNMTNVVQYHQVASQGSTNEIMLHLTHPPLPNCTMKS